MFTLTKSEVKDQDVSELLPHVGGCDKKNFVNDGEWYKLLSYISFKFDNVNFLDIGTRHGASAVALGHNPNNHVLSYDIRNWGPSSTLPNITFVVKNLLEGDMELIDNISLITLDVDPHDGNKERQFLEKIKTRDWKGILILDDIGPGWPNMEKMWNEISDIKYDISDVGHSSGTGIIDFSKELVIQ